MGWPFKNTNYNLFRIHFHLPPSKATKNIISLENAGTSHLQDCGIFHLSRVQCVLKCLIFFIFELLLEYKNFDKQFRHKWQNRGWKQISPKLYHIKTPITYKTAKSWLIQQSAHTSVLPCLAPLDWGEMRMISKRTLFFSSSLIPLASLTWGINSTRSSWLAAHLDSNHHNININKNDGEEKKFNKKEQSWQSQCGLSPQLFTHSVRFIHRALKVLGKSVGG